MSTNIAVTPITLGTFTTPGTYDGTARVAGVAVAAATEYSFFNDGRVFLFIINTNATADAVGLVISNISSLNGIKVPNMTLKIPGSGTGGGTVLHGPFNTGSFNQISGTDINKVVFTTSSGTAITAGAVSVWAYSF